MKEVRLSNRELQALIAPGLIAKLKAAGFQAGRSSGECCAVVFPINLNFSGTVDIERTDDGVWTFRQQDDVDVASRTEFAAQAHAAAVSEREGPRCP